MIYFIISNILIILSLKILDIARYNNLNVKQFKKRILWYDHEFLIIKS